MPLSAWKLQIVHPHPSTRTFTNHINYTTRTLVVSDIGGATATAARIWQAAQEITATQQRVALQAVPVVGVGLD